MWACGGFPPRPGAAIRDSSRIAARLGPERARSGPGAGSEWDPRGIGPQAQTRGAGPPPSRADGWWGGSASRTHRFRFRSVRCCCARARVPPTFDHVATFDHILIMSGQMWQVATSILDLDQTRGLDPDPLIATVNRLERARHPSPSLSVSSPGSSRTSVGPSQADQRCQGLYGHAGWAAGALRQSPSCRKFVRVGPGRALSPSESHRHGPLSSARVIPRLGLAGPRSVA